MWGHIWMHLTSSETAGVSANVCTTTWMGAAMHRGGGGMVWSVCVMLRWTAAQQYKLLMWLNQHWLCCGLIDIGHADREARGQLPCLCKIKCFHLPFRHLIDIYAGGWFTGWSDSGMRSLWKAGKVGGLVICKYSHKHGEIMWENETAEKGSSSYCTNWLLTYCYTHMIMMRTQAAHMHTPRVCKTKSLVSK